MSLVTVQIWLLKFQQHSERKEFQTCYRRNFSKDFNCYRQNPSLGCLTKQKKTSPIIGSGRDIFNHLCDFFISMFVSIIIYSKVINSNFVFDAFFDSAMHGLESYPASHDCRQQLVYIDLA